MTAYIVMGRDNDDHQMARIVHADCGEDALEAGATQDFVPNTVWDMDDLQMFLHDMQFGKADVIAAESPIQ